MKDMNEELAIDEDKIVDEVGKFYAKIYDDTVNYFERIKVETAKVFKDSDDVMELVRLVTHSTLENVAAELQENEEWERTPSVRCYLYVDGDEIKNLDGLISPIVGWLSDVVPGEGLLGIYAQTPPPKVAAYEILREKMQQAKDQPKSDQS